MSHYLRLGTYDFPVSSRVVEMPQEVSFPAAEIPRRHGLAYGGMRLRGKTIVIEGILQHASQVREVRDAVMAQVAGGRQKLYIEDLDRYLWVNLSSFSEEEAAEGLSLNLARQIAIELVSDSPLWEADTESSSTWNSPTDGTDITITNAGNADTYPVFALTLGGTGTLDIAITTAAARTFTLQGEIATGDVLLVDCLEQRCTLQADNTDKMALFDGLFPWFTPGANVVSYTDNGSSAAVSSIVTKWRGRWH